MAKAFEIFDAAIENICKLLLIAEVVIVTWVVIGRFVFRSTPSWGEQSALLCTVWLGLLSCTLAVKSDSHLNILLIEKYTSKKVLEFFDKINYVFMIMFSIFMIIEGTKITMLSSLNIIPGLNIKSSWIFASVPVTGFIILIQLLRKVRILKNAK